MRVQFSHTLVLTGCTGFATLLVSLCRRIPPLPVFLKVLHSRQEKKRCQTEGQQGEDFLKRC